MASVSKSMTVSTIQARAMRSFGLEDGDCKGFRNINKSVICGEHHHHHHPIALRPFQFGLGFPYN